MYLGNFTPGPWRVIDRGPSANNVINPDMGRYWIGHGRFNGSVEQIAALRIECQGPIVEPLDCVNNAHLIAAAPELFRECVFAREMLLNMSESDPVFAYDIGTRNFLSRLEELISRVRGQKCSR